MSLAFAARYSSRIVTTLLRAMALTMKAGAHAMKNMPQACGPHGTTTAPGRGVHHVERSEAMPALTQSADVGTCPEDV